MSNGTASSPAMAPTRCGGPGPQLGLALGPGHPAGGPGNHRVGYDIWLTLASVFIFGVFLVIGGGVQIFRPSNAEAGSILWHGLIAVFYVLAGISIMADPLAASTLFTLLWPGPWWASGGAPDHGLPVARRQKLVLAPDRGHRRHFPGIMILARWPVSGLWVIGLFVAIEMIFGGWAYIFIALGAKEVGSKTAGAT